MKEDSSLRLCSLEGKITREGGCWPLFQVNAIKCDCEAQPPVGLQ